MYWNYRLEEREPRSELCYIFLPSLREYSTAQRSGKYQTVWEKWKLIRMQSQVVCRVLPETYKADLQGSIHPRHSLWTHNTHITCQAKPV